MPTTAELATQLEALSARLSQSEQTNLNLSARLSQSEQTNLNLQKTNEVLINRIQLLEQRVDPQPNLADLISTIKDQQLTQEALLKEALLSNNLISSRLLTPLDSTASSTKPASMESNAFHSLIFPGPTIQSDSIRDIIDAFRKLKQIQQKSKNPSDSYIFDYFRLHAPDVFGSLLAKYRIHFSAPHFQFHSPDSDFMTDVYSALFPAPTTHSLHQLFSAWRPDTTDSSQMSTFLISIRTLFRTMPNFFQHFTPLSILDAIRFLLSPSLQAALDIQRGTVMTHDDILPCLIRIQHQHPSSYRNPFHDSHTYPSMYDPYQSRRDPRTSSTPRDSPPPRDSQSPRTSLPNQSTQTHHRSDQHASPSKQISKAYNIALAPYDTTIPGIPFCEHCHQGGHDHEFCTATCTNEECLENPHIKNPHPHKDCPFLDYFESF